MSTFHRIIVAIGIVFATLITLSYFNGCMRESEPPNYLAGNTYSYTEEGDSSLVFVAKFTKDSLFYFMYEDGQNGFCATAYTIEKLDNHSNYKITVETIPEWWNSDQWNIEIKEKGIQSLITKRFYSKEIGE